MEKVLLPLFVGDERDSSTKRLMTWLFLKDFPIGDLMNTPLTPDYIPVIHTELIKGMIVTTWPAGFVRPQWCADRQKVLLFRERMLSQCPQGQLIEAINRLVSPAHA